jgi:hydrogenase maturation factor HypF (carbamoyltransferase family)
MLENAAAEALDAGLAPWSMDFEISQRPAADPKIAGNEEPVILLSAGSVFRRTEEALSAGVDKRRIALGFHYAVAEMILEACEQIRRREDISAVALTGGVFQNKILMERTLALLRREGFRPYYNISVGPNDGGVCLGQNLIGMKYLTRK